MAIDQVLLGVAALLERDGAWTQRATARDFAGREVEATSAAAMCWCICGAVDKVLLDFPEETYERVLEPLGGDQAAIRVNDKPGTTQADVVRFIRSRAALSLKENGNG